MATLPDALVDFSYRDPGLGLGVAATSRPHPSERSVDDVFHELYEAHGARIHRFLCDLLGDRALAADATQETFVRAFQTRGRFEDGKLVAPWLFGIARNVSLELRRSRGRARRVVCSASHEATIAEARAAASPESELLGREALRVVEAALEQLSDDRRAMLLLHLDHGLSYDEVAALMGFSLAKVKVEIFRAREVLRATMANYEKGGGT